MNNITEERQLTYDERIKLCRYIYAYRFRSPWMLNRLQARYEPDMRGIIKELSDRLSFLYAALYDTDRPIDKEPLETVKGILLREEKVLNDAEKVKSSLRAFFSEGHPLTHTPQHADTLLASLPWRVFISTDRPFVLGDFFFQVNGLDQPIFEMLCPISSNHCLLISRFALHPTQHTGDIEYIRIDDQTTRAINVRTAVSSVKYVISGQDLSWVLRARKTPAITHQTLKVPNMQTEQLVGGYLSSRCPKCWWALATGEILERQLGEIKGDTVALNTFTQRTCSNPSCGFVTDFRSGSDKVVHQLGPEAVAIHRRLRPADRDTIPIEEAG